MRPVQGPRHPVAAAADAEPVRLRGRAVPRSGRGRRTSSGRAAASRTATRPPSEWPTTTSPAPGSPPRGSSSRRATAAAYSTDPHGSGGAGVAPKPGRSGARVGSGAAVGAGGGPEGGGEVGVGPAPPVQRHHGRGTLAPGLAVQRPTGERPQHLGEATSEVPRLRPIPRRRLHPADTVASVPSSPPVVGRCTPRLCGVSPSPNSRPSCLSDPPLCVLAAAGSGKTTVLARRVARRILDGSARAEHTLVVTFTRKASRELRDRLERLGVPGAVSAGTFHAARLRPAPPPLGRPGRAPSRRDRRSRPAGAGRARRRGPDQAGAGRRRARRDPLGPGEHGPPRRTTPAAAGQAGRDAVLGRSHLDLAEVYAAYIAEKSRRNVLDLDDLVTRCASVLEEDPAAAAAQTWRIRHVFVDEFQDVNPAQWRLLKAWLGDRARPLRRRRPPSGHLRLERGRPHPARSTSRAPARHHRAATRRQPPVHAPGHRSGPGRAREPTPA